jgi:hypothetical protein
MSLIDPSDLEDGRPRCAGCGEPVELTDSNDPESWIHAADANYFGDHTAWIEEELN